MPTPGDTICGEIVLEQLAPSSLGAEAFQPVFVARDQSRDEHLWLTVIDGSFVPSSMAMSTFMAGANGLVGMRHPSLVRAVLVDREEDYCVVGYEQLPGAEPLSDLVVRGGSRRVLARAAVEVARGLAYLHRHELLHGALTTGTVVLWEGVPVLWEYGLAGLCDPAIFGPRARTMGGDVVAPEVPSGAPLTPAVDVYGWGAVMASIASGELGSEAVAAVLENDVDPGRHGALLGVIRQALSADARQRPRDGVHLLELLQRALSSTDPNTELGEPSPASEADDGLRELALRYLAEMETVQKTVSSPPAGAPSASPPPADAPGALGRVALVKRPAGEASGPKGGRGRPWLAGTPIKEIDRREPSGPLPISGPPAPEPDWSHRLPSSAVAEVPKTEGPGLVRGPEPGVSGADAGMLAAQAKAESARWVSPKVTASGWLRPADPYEGLGGLFDAKAPMLELPDGVRKRSILRPGSLPSPPADAPPRGVPVPLPDDQETPQEPLEVDGPPPPRREPSYDALSGLDAPATGGLQSERETPPDLAIQSPPSHAQPPPPEPPPPAAPSPAAELPPSPGDELPPAPESSGRHPEPGPGRSVAREPFRVPRRPGPHGPPAVLMGVGICAIAGVLALGATLSASSARGGFGNMLGRGGEGAVVAGDGGDAGGVDPSADDGAAAGKGPCPEGMVEIRDDAQHFCIDRAEYPGIDRVPAGEVDLPHAEQACGARGHALCTEAQWSRACEGASKWRFPYGPRREAGRCRVGDPSASPGPSGADPHCVTPEGVLDLVGNVSEWTAEGVVMGGSIRSKKSAGCATKQRLKGKTKRPAVGFRCCMAIEGDGEGEPEPTSDGEG